MSSRRAILSHASQDACTADAYPAAGAATAGPRAGPGEPMSLSREQLEGEIRYAIRLTQRTARLYRNLQAAGVFLAIVGGSATLSVAAHWLPDSAGALCAVLFALSGAGLLAVRPGDKAAANEADLRRYEALKVRAHALGLADLALAIDEAHRGGTQEIEALRLVAYNDVAREFNRGDMVQPLSLRQRLLAALA